MDQRRPSGEQSKIVQLAEYRRRLALGDNERPPPSPRPAAARWPPPLISTDAFGQSTLHQGCRLAGLPSAHDAARTLAGRQLDATMHVGNSRRQQ
jgi:hypothetical protein